MQGRGRVYARTWYELSVRVPMTAVEKRGEGKTTTRVALDVGKQRIKIYGKGSMLGAGCDKIVTYHPLTLPFGLRLPPDAGSGDHHGLRHPVRRPTAAQARAEGEVQRCGSWTTCDEGGTVTSTRFSTAQQGDMLLVTLAAECYEEIGVSVAVEVE